MSAGFTDALVEFRRIGFLHGSLRELSKSPGALRVSVFQPARECHEFAASMLTAVAGVSSRLLAEIALGEIQRGQHLGTLGRR
jgi:hypothetical protein